MITDNYTETFTDTMLSPGQTYEYEVFAVSRSGIVSTNALKATFNDNTFPPAAWPAGSRLEAKEWKKDSVNLTWTPAENAKEYRVYQDGNLLGTELGNRNTYFVDQLTPGTTYTFKVEAGNETGKWTTSGPQLTITKDNGDQEPPNISSVQPTDNAVVYTPNPVISAVVSDRGVGARSGIAVYLDEECLDGIKEDVEKGTVKVLTYGLSNGKHTLRIRADDLVGNKAETITSFTVAFEPDGPVWPEGSTLSVSKVTSSSLTLNWAPAQGATGYRIYQDGSVVDSVYGEVYSYTVTGLQPQAWYMFSVEAFDGVGRISQKSLTKKAWTEIPIELWPPDSRLEAQEWGKDSAILSWTPAKNVKYYQLYKNGIPIDTLFSHETKREVNGLVPGTAYTFKVEARDIGAWTSGGPELTMTKGDGDLEPPVISDVRPADQAVVYTPDPVISAVITDSGVGVYATMVTVDGQSLPYTRYNTETRTMTASAHGLSIGRHTLEIVSWDKVNNRAESITSFIVAPAPSGPVWPEGSTLTASNVTSSSLTLSWTLAQGATGYRIYRDGSVAGSVYGSVYSYDVGRLQPDTTYTFTVEAVDAAGNVSLNNPVTTVKTKAAQGTTQAFRLRAWPGFLNAGFATRVGPPGYDSLYDLNNDGVIDGTDVQFVADKIAG
ncbi:Fibronectin type III domain-containing protein [Paenibacillus tianmuensis]|uniref:Fibronectin type III domain-containing protein n=1 Tax=Paenibacillus tianmuensis TaxID=624147 RepID=A0A1G4RUT3_9BACL|nr:fibronectin type III domain-containing protein [Paenibacillus tianmuensis]SCW60491.1 Fibronectin type III domain-containing protein [Paenibacillus tianmuensis]